MRSDACAGFQCEGSTDEACPVARQQTWGPDHRGSGSLSPDATPCLKRASKPGSAQQVGSGAEKRLSEAEPARKEMVGLEGPRAASLLWARLVSRQELARPCPHELVEVVELRVGPHPCTGDQQPRRRPRSAGPRTRSNLPLPPFPRPLSDARSNASAWMSRGSRHRACQDRAAGKCTGAVRRPDSGDGSGRTDPSRASETPQGRQSAGRPGPSCRLGLKVGVRTASARLRPRCRSSCEC
jgi:hypothetical protein